MTKGPSDAWFLLPLLVATFLWLPSSATAQQQQQLNGNGFNISTVGDWGCTENTDATVQNIFSRNPELDADISLTIFDGALDPGT
jgi:hypothetical protein